MIYDKQLQDIITVFFSQEFSIIFIDYYLYSNEEETFSSNSFEFFFSKERFMSLEVHNLETFPVAVVYFYKAQIYVDSF